MLRLDKVPSEPYWLDVAYAGVSLLVRPPSTALNAQALDSATRSMAGLAKEIADRKQVGAPLDGLPDMANEAIRTGYVKQAYAIALGQAAILDWKGVETEDGPIPVTLDNVAPLMRIDPIGSSFS